MTGPGSFTDADRSYVGLVQIRTSNNRQVNDLHGGTLWCDRRGGINYGVIAFVMAQLRSSDAYALRYRVC
jgi:hypothetical protein